MGCTNRGDLSGIETFVSLAFSVGTALIRKSLLSGRQLIPRVNSILLPFGKEEANAILLKVVSLVKMATKP